MDIQIPPVKCSCGATLVDTTPGVDAAIECDSCDSMEWLHPVEHPIRDSDIKSGMITVAPRPTSDSDDETDTSSDAGEIKTVNSGGSVYVGSDLSGQDVRIVPDNPESESAADD